MTTTAWGTITTPYTRPAHLVGPSVEQRNAMTLADLLCQRPAIHPRFDTVGGAASFAVELNADGQRALCAAAGLPWTPKTWTLVVSSLTARAATYDRPPADPTRPIRVRPLPK